MKKRYLFGGIFVVLSLVFFMGPKPQYPEINTQIPPLKYGIGEAEAQIAAQEARVENLKPNNESRIVWFDSVRPTEYSIVFLPGFSASPMEGIPVVTELASRYGCNLYLARLEGHGIDSEESFADLSPAGLVESGAEAIAIGNMIGKKTVLVGSSTGCTVGAYLAAHNPDKVDGLMFFAPNIDLADPLSELLLWPWGQQIAEAVSGKYYSYPQFKDTPSEQYWTTTYRVEGLLAVKYLLKETMTEETFEKINDPLLVSYYYRNDTAHDETISIPDVNRFYEGVSTPENQKRLETVQNAGGHVVLSDLQCDDVEEVKVKAFAFAEEVLGWKVAALPPDTLTTVAEDR